MGVQLPGLIVQLNALARTLTALEAHIEQALAAHPRETGEHDLQAQTTPKLAAEDRLSVLPLTLTVRSPSLLPSYCSTDSVGQHSMAPIV